MIEIRRMDESHVSAVAEMEKLFFSTPWSENSVRSELENSLSLWLVALDGETVCGYVGSQTAAGESDVMNLAVLPAYQRRGIGGMLTETLVKELRAAGSEALLLEVRESNAPAIGLYEKMGFVSVGVRPNYYFKPKENAIIMRKELKEL